MCQHQESLQEEHPAFLPLVQGLYEQRCHHRIQRSIQLYTQRENDTSHVPRAGSISHKNPDTTLCHINWPQVSTNSLCIYLVGRCHPLLYRSREKGCQVPLLSLEHSSPILYSTTSSITHTQHEYNRQQAHYILYLPLAHTRV